MNDMNRGGMRSCVCFEGENWGTSVLTISGFAAS